MIIRQAESSDAAGIAALARRCPQGVELAVRFVPKGDPFARSRLREKWAVFVAEEEGKIVGSIGCAIENTMLAGGVRRQAYLYGAQVDGQLRRRGVGQRLLDAAERYAKDCGANFAKGFVASDNVPSLRLCQRAGYHALSECRIYSVFTFQRQRVSNQVYVRTLRREDLPEVARLLNAAYEGLDFYMPTDVSALERQIARVPHVGFDEVFVAERQGRITACVGYWDYSKLVRIEIAGMALKYRLGKLILDALGRVVPLPRVPGPGEELRAYNAVLAGFALPGDMVEVLKHVCNVAYENRMHVLNVPIGSDHLEPIARRFLHGTVRLRIVMKALTEEAVPELRKVYVGATDF
ncbi:MAG: GNAT family N-acetyltransferase [Chloroflexi bacterium]|nr:GNAT family N-acetyltransferase [Chloroflexota bacterium]